ncbi:DEAD/DEAH box helicase family protein [Bacillus toyonensis]|uniref:DEAD/DEAH box helicase family protein n=1 Tax=Bacillus toyonensis TaxID=155322 RepID=UPI002E203F9B|nr:DEAD/DEAH box helicase family protein [Bacillus toyonensis]MED2737303.1 DEAD/DEAH box helicase family protein [Bacillus toyonensis]
MNNLRLNIDNGEENFSLNSDLLIVKETNKNNQYEVIAVSLYGTKTDFNKLLKKNTGLIAELSGLKNNDRTKVIIKNLSYYEKSEASGTYHQRITLVKKTDDIIDQTDEKYPIVIIPKKNISNFNTIVFEHVRENVVSPLFPNVYIPQILAGELYVSIHQAENILRNVESGNVTSDNEIAATEMILMYDDWVKYLVKELESLNRIKQLEIIKCTSEVIAVEIHIIESEIKEIISKGLQTGAITLSKSKLVNNNYSDFDEYMPMYSDSFKHRIESISEPIHRKGVYKILNTDSLSRLGRKPIPEQLEIIEAGLKSLKLQKRMVIVGEPGVGKTFMMSTIAYLDSLSAKRAMKLLVLSPDHLVESAWQNEAEITLIESEYHHINSVSDLQAFEKSGYFNDSTPRVFILSQTAAKNGYSKRPTAIWKTRLIKSEDEENKYIDSKVFCCPKCGEIIKKKKKNTVQNDNEPKYIEVPVEFDHFSSEKNTNYKCSDCHTVLWAANNKNASSLNKNLNSQIKKDSIVYTSVGFIPNDLNTLKREIEYCEKKVVEKPSKMLKTRLTALRDAEKQLMGEQKAKISISPYKVSIAEYILKKMNKVFTHLIIDELHEFQNEESSRGKAFGKLVSACPKIIAGTGTMMNGYAKSLFYMFYILFPQKMKRAGFDINDNQKFQNSFGVTEKRIRVTPDNKRVPLPTKSKPGISPIIFPLFLQDTTAFIALKDLDDHLPKIFTKPVEVELPKELIEGKEQLENAVANLTKGDVKLFKSTMPILYSYLDMPTVPKEIKDENGNVVYKTKPLSEFEDIKLEAVKEIVKDEVQNQNNRVIIYTYYTSDGINNYIKGKLEAEGYSVTVLNKNTEYSISCTGDLIKVPKKKREKFIKDEVKKGAEVLICNPELVKTGTNLIDFAPIIRYQMDYQVYTERQGRGRTRRIGQTKNCTIYYVFYKDSFQEDVTSLMATKIVASEAIEGKMDAQGLDAISNDRTPEEELAKKFFKKMNLE